MYKELFYQRLIRYSTLQKFIATKFFPSTIDEQIRHMLILEDVKIELIKKAEIPQLKLAADKKKKKNKISKAQQYLDEYAQIFVDGNDRILAKPEIEIFS